MTHDELLSKVHSVFYEEEGGTQLDIKAANNQYRALYAVVELHKPIYRGCDDDRCCGSSDTCYHCGDEYPCDTIQAIEKELG